MFISPKNLEKQKKEVLREHLKIRSIFDPLKVYNYHLVKVFKENISHFTLFFHFSTHI
jgi:hypothetical protein